MAAGELHRKGLEVGVSGCQSSGFAVWLCVSVVDSSDSHWKDRGFGTDS